MHLAEGDSKVRSRTREETRVPEALTWTQIRTTAYTYFMLSFLGGDFEI